MSLNSPMEMGDDSGEPVTATLNLITGSTMVKNRPDMHRIRLRGNLVTFGRALTNKVVLDCGQISRHHASLEYRTNKWFIKDVSTNGILINFRKYEKNDWLELQDMDVIQFIPTGVLQYRIRYVDRVSPQIPQSSVQLVRTATNPVTPGTSNISALTTNLNLNPRFPEVEEELPDIGDDSDSNESVSLLSGRPSEESMLSVHEMPSASESVPKKRLCDIPKSDSNQNRKRVCGRSSANGSEEEEELPELDEDESSFIRIIKSFHTPPEHRREAKMITPLKRKSNDPKEQMKFDIEYLTEKCKRLEEEKAAEKLKNEKELEEVQSKLEAYKYENHKKLLQLLEQDFSCSVCSEIFIQATVVDCGHTFCSFCIGQWTKKKMDCPNCRKAVTKQSKHIELENFLTKIHDIMSDEIKKKRAQSIKDREDQQLKSKESEKRQRVGNGYGFAPERFVDFLAELQHINDMFGGHGAGFMNGNHDGGAAQLATNRGPAPRRRSIRNMRNRIGIPEVEVQLQELPLGPPTMPVGEVIVSRRGRARVPRGPLPPPRIPPPQMLEPGFQLINGQIVRVPHSPNVITIDDSVDEGRTPPAPQPRFPGEPQPGPSRLLNC